MDIDLLIGKFGFTNGCNGLLEVLLRMGQSRATGLCRWLAWDSQDMPSATSS